MEKLLRFRVLEGQSLLGKHLDESSLFSSPRWLKVMNGRIEGKNFMFLLEKASCPVMMVHGSILDSPTSYNAYNPYDLMLAEEPVFPINEKIAARRSVLRQVTRREDWFPCLILMWPGYECTMAGQEYSNVQMMRILIREIASWAQSKGLKLIGYLYVPEDKNDFTNVLAEQGYQKFPLTYKSELRLLGNSFDDYINGLKKKQRSGIKREIQFLYEAGVKTEVCPLNESGEDLLRLRIKLVRKYGNYSSLDEEYRRLERLKDAFSSEDLLVARAMADGDLIGFTLFLQHKDFLYAFWTGTDYEHPKSSFVHFDTAFYSVIPKAYRLGIIKIGYGIGHWQGKKRRGCDVTAVDGWLLGIHSFVQMTLKQLKEEY
ncbi:GNAT family N-acetyltransferase [Thermoflavimicrobium daqui]|nr:GNAT family N-acetyltransferase [Thermoflavimicrobium daqui]